MRNALNRSIAAKGQLPQVSVSWTKQELMKLAKLLSGRPAAPSGALIRAMKWDVSAISVAVMSGATSSGSRIQESSKSPSKTIARTAEQKRRRELEEAGLE